MPTTPMIRNADNLLIGWYSGPRALGFYYRAYQMLLGTTQQFNSPLGGVVIPALSRLQTEPRRYAAYYHTGILLSAATGMPLVAFLFVGTGWIVAGFFALSRQFPFTTHGLAGLAASLCLFGLMYIGFWLALPGGRRSLWSLFRLVRFLRNE